METGPRRSRILGKLKGEMEMREKSSFPYRKFDRKPHPYIVKQILEDHQMTERMREALIQASKPCPFCHRKLGKKKEKGNWE
jgi:hypothetical protein